MLSQRSYPIGAGYAFAVPKALPDPPSVSGSDARPATGSPAEQTAGLCASCAHRRLVPNTRGSVFYLCERSREDPRSYPRYPRLPVLSCPGYERSRGG